MIQNKKVAAIVRADVTGLGMHTQDWVNHLPIDKVLVVWGNKGFNEQLYAHKEMLVTEYGIPTKKEMEWMLEDIDLLLTIETPYNWNIIKRAREKGVKTVIAPNYEWMEENPPEQPDLWLCYNPLTPDYIHYDNKVYLPQPIDRDIFSFKKRKKAKTFLFNNGNGGAYGRNCLKEFLAAIPFIKSDVKFIINSQVPFDCPNDRRIQPQVGDQQMGDIWKEGDVFIHLRKFGANSLPVNEAMGLGFPIIGVDRKPENMILPKELLVKPDKSSPLKCRDNVVEIDAKLVNPMKIAEKIDEIAKTDISEYSLQVDRMAEKWSWKKLRPLWIKTFENLLEGKIEQLYKQMP